MNIQGGGKNEPLRDYEIPEDDANESENLLKSEFKGT
jgi:hypothetical protein